MSIGAVIFGIAGYYACKYAYLLSGAQYDRTKIDGILDRMFRG